MLKHSAITVLGSTQHTSSVIKDQPAHIRDIVATIYRLLGIDPEMAALDRANRPVPIAHGGRPIIEILS